jgi:hypothetical protein
LKIIDLNLKKMNKKILIVDDENPTTIGVYPCSGCDSW